MIILSIKCDFLLAFLVTGPLDHITDKTLLTQILCCQGAVPMGLWNIALGRGMSFSCHLPFSFSPIKNTTEICSWSNFHIYQFFVQLVKEKRKFRLWLSVPGCLSANTPPPTALLPFPQSLPGWADGSQSSKAKFHPLPDRPGAH